MDETLPGPDEMPDTKGADPDLVREELESGGCSPKQKNTTPMTSASLSLLGAGSPYMNRNGY